MTCAKFLEYQKVLFIIFFDSKEALFYEVIISAHNKLVKITEDGLKKMYD